MQVCNLKMAIKRRNYMVGEIIINANSARLKLELWLQIFIVKTKIQPTTQLN